MHTRRAVSTKPPRPVLHPETRSYLAAMTVRNSRGQLPAASIIRGNDEFRSYYSDRGKSQKTKIDEALDGCTPDFDTQSPCLTVFLVLSLLPSLLTSSQTTPMSAFFPIVLALRNGLNFVLRAEMFDDYGAETWDAIFGEGSLQEMVDINKVRFNMAHQLQMVLALHVLSQ